MRKLLLTAVAVAALAGAGGGGWYWWTEGRYVESTDNAYVQSDISVAAPKLAGYVRQVLVTDNQQVAAGDLLVTIDDQEFAAKLADARAAVEAQRAAFASLDAKTTLQRSLIAQAQASVASADADLRRTQQDLARYRPLVKDDFVSRQKMETVEADQRKADAALAKARASVAAETSQIGVIEAQRREIQAKLQQAEANLKLAENDMANTVIRAPVDGVVGNRSAQVGQYVRAGSQLMAVVPLDNVHVVANFKETQLGRMRLGQTVSLKVDAFPDQIVTGRIESLAPASGAQFSLLPPENATGNFTKIVQRVPVRIAVPSDNALAGLLRPGLSVEASVDTRGVAGPALAGGIFGAALAASR